jgi:hypothetical protein
VFDRNRGGVLDAFADPQGASLTSRGGGAINVERRIARIGDFSERERFWMT